MKVLLAFLTFFWAMGCLFLWSVVFQGWNVVAFLLAFIPSLILWMLLVTLKRMNGNKKHIDEQKTEKNAFNVTQGTQVNQPHISDFSLKPVINGILVLGVIIFIIGIIEDKVKNHKTKEYFTQNREQIIQSLKLSMLDKDYESVLSESEKYVSLLDDEKLTKIYAEASKMLKYNLAKKILAKLKTIPTKEYENNRKLYQALADLYPKNIKYKNKVDFYELKQESQLKKRKKQLKKRKKEEALAKARKEKERNFYKYRKDRIDGLIANVQSYLKKNMRDPDSFEVIKRDYRVYDNKNHVKIIIVYRGRNGFGGMVVNRYEQKMTLDGVYLYD